MGLPLNGGLEGPVSASVSVTLILAARVASLDLSSVEVGEWEEVVDPASGDQADFDECAATLDRLVDRLVDRVGPGDG